MYSGHVSRVAVTLPHLRRFTLSNTIASSIARSYGSQHCIVW